MRILITDPNLESFRAQLDAALVNDDVHWHSGITSPAAAVEVTEAHVIVGPSLPGDLARRATSLRLVQVAGTGTDGIDFAALPPGAVCANVGGHENSIAEYVVSTAVMMRRHFVTQDAALRHGKWLAPAYDKTVPLMPSLAETAIGFVGFGGIGAASWNGFRALGARSGRAVRRRVPPETSGLEWVATLDRLDDLFAESDVVVVAIPHNAETSGLIGEHQLRLLGRDGLLINVARGPVVDEKALYESLRDNVIGGAVIDVWWNYPSGAGKDCAPSNYPFGTLDNAFLTPHVSGVTSDTFSRRVDEILANIERVRAGDPIHRQVPNS